jgi:SAM-dependent methyltransferase
VAASDLKRFYDESYRGVYEGNHVPLDKQLANPTYGFRVRRLTRHSKGRRFLDVGCGDGSFLAVLRSHGWDVSGREVSETAAKVIRERHGIDVEVSSCEDVGSVPTGCWDAVGLYHVLEHMYEPRAALKQIHEALPVGGVVHVQVPNRRSLDGRLGSRLWSGVCCPEHVLFYEPRHLRQLLSEEGFGVVSVQTYDPWHSPRIVDYTVRGLLKSSLKTVLRRNARLEPSTEVDSSQTESELKWVRLTPHLLLRALRVVSVVVARTQSAVGFGNVADVIAVRT